jgi:hypothetical protein
VEVECELITDDMLAVQRYLGRDKVWHRPTLWVFLLGLLVFGGVAVIVAVNDPRELSFRGLRLPLLCAGVLLLAFIRGLYGKRLEARLFSWLFRKSVSPAFFEKHRFGITPEGMTEDTANISLTVRWTGITKIVRAPEHVFFITSPRHGVPIPLRAFPNEQAFENFIEMAAQYRAEAWGESPESAAPGSAAPAYEVYTLPTRPRALPRGKALAAAGCLLFFVPVVGLVLTVAAMVANRRVEPWKSISGIALVLSATIHTIIVLFIVFTILSSYGVLPAGP